MANELERIVLGSGKTFYQEFTGEIPEDTAIETDENLMGWIQGGATVEYRPTFYDAKDDLGKVAKEVITDEEVLFKTGVMTWNANTLDVLTKTGRVTESGSKRSIKIGGVGNQNGKKYLIRFLHEDKMDGNVRVTIVGNNRAGFTLEFLKDKETVINAEIKALPMDGDGTLLLYEEDIPTA